jgi:DnaJ homolog subfamily C member 9
VSAEAIKKFAKKYKKSDEEKDDILVAYEQSEGDMDAVYESVMLSNVLEDDDRFRSIIDDAIASGDVPAFTKYTKETKKSKKDRMKAAQGEAAEAEDYAKELGVHDKLYGQGKGKGKSKKGGSDDALAALIKQRQAGRADFFDSLAEKYGAVPKGKKGKKRGAEEEEPSEEAFQAAAARLNKPFKASKKTRS